jgi:aminopeptidase N
MFDYHTYPGGSWRLHMLRRKLGEENFWTGVQNYISENLKKTVETEDFRKALERASGLNLSKFFDQWLYSKGYPQIKLEYKYDAKKNVVQFSAQQKQENKKTGIPVFHFSLNVALNYSDGTSATVTLDFDSDHVVVFANVPQNASVESINVDPNTEVLFSLDFDPGEDVLKNTFVKGTILANV